MRDYLIGSAAGGSGDRVDAAAPIVATPTSIINIPKKTAYSVEVIGNVPALPSFEMRLIEHTHAHQYIHWVARSPAPDSCVH